MERTNLQSIGKILEGFFDANPRMANKLAETRLMNYWNTGMSPAIVRYTDNLRIRNRVLYVKLTSSVLKNELLMHRQQLVQNLNKEAGREVIDDIMFT